MHLRLPRNVLKVEYKQFLQEIEWAFDFPSAVRPMSYTVVLFTEEMIQWMAENAQDPYEFTYKTVDHNLRDECGYAPIFMSDHGIEISERDYILFRVRFGL